LAVLYYNQRKYGEAEPLLVQALAIFEQQLGTMHPKTALQQSNLAELYYAQGKYKEAEFLYQRALAIYHQALGSQHPTTQSIRENYTSLLESMKQGETSE